MQPIFRQLLILMLAASASGASLNQLTVVADPWCPFNCQEYSGRPGIMIELAQAALGEANIELEYQTINWARAAQWVIQGERDAIVGMGRSANTEAKFLFPDTPLAFTQVCFYRRADEHWTFNEASDLNGRTLGWINQYRFGDEAVDQWLRDREGTGAVVTVAGDSELVQSLIKMLNRDRIDTFGEVRTNVDYANQALTEEPDVVSAGCLPNIDDVYLAFSPESERSMFFANALDRGMRIVLQDTARLETLFDRYGLNLQNYLQNLENMGLYPMSDED